MRKLLSAHLFRMRCNRLFWLSLALMFAVGLLTPVNYWPLKACGYTIYIDHAMFQCAVSVPIVLSIFCSLFLGVEYGDGTIRNKLIVGHTHLSIYITTFALSFIAGIAMCVAWFIPYLAVGVPLLGEFSLDSGTVLCHLLGVLALIAAYAAIYTLIVMVCQRKAVIVISCLLCVFILLFTGIYTEARLSEPAGWEAHQYIDSEGNIATHPATKNPSYPEGSRRSILQFLNDFLPGGQSLAISNLNTDYPVRLAAYSALITLGTTVAGAIIFGRKDIM